KQGKFVITELSETIEDQDSTGAIFCYNVNISLKEANIPDPLKQEQLDNKKNAQAVGDKKPVIKPKSNPSTCAKLISDIVNKIYNHYSVISKIVVEQG